MRNILYVSMLTFTLGIYGHPNLFAKEDNHEEHHEDEVVVLEPQNALNAGIQTQATGQQSIETTTQLTGRIILNEDQTADIRARFSGEIESVQVSLGDKVQKGQVLANLISIDGLGQYKLTAPFAGTITFRKPHLGDISTGDKLFTISDISSVWAKFHVFPNDAQHIKVGKNIRVRTLNKSAFGDAKVSIVSPIADEYSQTLVAIAELDNTKRQWRAGMTVEGDLEINKQLVDIAVDNHGIQNYEGHSIVFVQEGHRYVPRAVELGVSDETYTEVLSGLKAGEIYVAQGSFVIKSELLKSSATHAH